MPNTLESNSWMVERQASRSTNDHRSFEDYEEDLIRNEECTVEAAGKFCTTVDATDEDCDGGNEEPLIYLLVTERLMIGAGVYRARIA